MSTLLKGVDPKSAYLSIEKELTGKAEVVLTAQLAEDTHGFVGHQ